MSDKTSISSLLASGQTADALRELQRKSPTPWQQAILLLQASLSQLEKEVMAGLISNEEAQRRRNQINSGALQLQEKVESGQTNPESLFLQLKSSFWNPQVAEEMARQAGHNTNISGSNINIQGSSEVIIGSGNTVNKKIFKALGRWQFWTILLVLAGVSGYMFLGNREITRNQTASLASLSEIQAQLKALAAEKGESFSQQLPQLQEQLKSGMGALQASDYPSAIKALKELSYQAPLASVYKNLAFAYEQNLAFEEAYKARQDALRVDPNAYPVQKAAKLKGEYLNLLIPENGGSVVSTSDPNLEGLIDHQLRNITAKSGSWAIFEFSEGHSAIIDRIDFYMPGMENYHVKSFELQVSADSENGPFTSVGVFEPQNAFLKKTPFQEFRFDPVEAKYVKLLIGQPHVESSYLWLYKIRLWGRLQ